MGERRTPGRKRNGLRPLAAAAAVLLAASSPEPFKPGLNFDHPYLQVTQKGWGVMADIQREKLPNGATLTLRLSEPGKPSSGASVSMDSEMLRVDNPAGTDERELIKMRMIAGAPVPGYKLEDSEQVSLNSIDSRPKELRVTLRSNGVTRELFKGTLLSLGTSVKHEGVSVHSEKRADPVKLREIAHEIAVLRPIMREEHDVQTAYFPIYGPETQYAAGGKGKGTADYEGPKVIFGNPQVLYPAKEYSDMQSPKRHLICASHEAAHGGFDSNKQTPAVKALVEQYAKSRRYERAKADAYTITFEKNQLFRVFDESTYWKLGDFWGHPYDNPNELFASGTTVMRHAPTQFIAELKRLKTTDAKRYAGALKIAKCIIQIHGKNAQNVFSKKMIDAINAR